MGRRASHVRGLCGGQQQLLLQPQLSFPQLLPPQLLLPQQQNSRTIMMISHRQEQLFPELKHMNCHLTCVSKTFYAQSPHRELDHKKSLCRGLSGSNGTSVIGSVGSPADRREVVYV